MTNLEYFEPTAQYKVIKAMIEDAEFFKTINKIVNQNAFEDKNARIIVGIISDYFKKNGYVPTYATIQYELLSKNGVDRNDAIKTISIIKGTSVDGIDSVMNMGIKYFKLKYLVGMANQILDRVEKGDDEELIIKQAQDKINKFNSTELEGTTTTIITEDVIREVVLDTEENRAIPTGIKELDDRMAGGLGRKEIGLFLAPTGYGKTTAGTIFANHAARQGYKVLQIFFEDKPSDIVRKHLACTTNTKVNDYKSKSTKEAEDIIKQLGSSTISMLKDNLILSKMADGTTTVEDIEIQINKYINQYGFKPDMMIIDYFSSLKHSTNPIKDNWTAQANAMRKIKELAFKYDMAIWVMQQTNRTAVSKDGDGASMANVQGSYEATQPVSVWLTLQRTKEQLREFRADIIFNKTRHSMPKDDLINIKFDNARLQIDCQDEKEFVIENNDDKDFVF